MKMTRQEKREAFGEFMECLRRLENRAPSRNLRDSDATAEELRELRSLLLKSEGVRLADELYECFGVDRADYMIPSDPVIKKECLDLKKLNRYLRKQPRLHVAQAIKMHPSSLKNRADGFTPIRYSELDAIADYLGYGIEYFIKKKRGKA